MAVTVRAKQAEAQEALGALLAIMQVGRQVVVRPDGGGLSTSVPPPWWLQDGYMWWRVAIPREDVREHVDARGNLRQGDKLKIWQRGLQTKGAEDALCVAVALQMACSIVSAVGEDRYGGVCQWWPYSLRPREYTGST